MKSVFKIQLFFFLLKMHNFFTKFKNIYFQVYLTTSGKDEPEVIEVRIWSDAVANLTLMALGSSAPEILLSCFEVAGLCAVLQIIFLYILNATIVELLSTIHLQ